MKRKLLLLFVRIVYCLKIGDTIIYINQFGHKQEYIVKDIECRLFHPKLDLHYDNTFDIGVILTTLSGEKWDNCMGINTARKLKS